MEQKKLLSGLKSGNFKTAYLLYGEERFLVSHYAKAIENAAISDSGYADNFDGAIPAREIAMAAQAVSFFTERRVIYVRDSRLFTTGRKEDSEVMTEFLPNIPKETIIIFIETEVDRRSRLFKQVSKVGVVLDCTTPTPNTLVTWVTRLAREHGKTIMPDVAHQFVRIVGIDMHLISQEMAKLIAYCGESGHINVEDVSAICTQTLESRIFDLTKAMCSGRVSDALSMYRNMLIMKESPIMVLSMIIRQFRIMLLSKAAKDKGLTILQTAKELNLRDFMVSEALGFKFTLERLLGALNDCQETDIKIKTGLISPEFGVEMLIIKYGQRN